MKKLSFLLVLFTLLSVNNSTAQYVVPQFSNNTFNMQLYQEKVKKFVDTLTPQEKSFFLSSMEKSSSVTECELDLATKRKIDDIYAILKEAGKIKCDSYYDGKLKCQR